MNDIYQVANLGYNLRYSYIALYSSLCIYLFKIKIMFWGYIILEKILCFRRTIWLLFLIPVNIYITLFNPRNVSLDLNCTAFIQPLAANDLFNFFINLPFPGNSIVGIIQYLAFSHWLLSLSNMHLSFLYVFSWLDSSLINSCKY